MSLSDKNKFEFEIRNIGGSDVYYKRNIGDKLWLFSTKEEFEQNINIMDKEYTKSDVEKGAEIEMEHKKTIEKFMKDGTNVKEVAKAIAIDHLEENPNAYPNEDVISMNVPLFIRMLELAREDIKSDEELHKVVEKVIIASKKEGYLTMADYDGFLENTIKENSFAKGGGVDYSFYSGRGRRIGDEKKPEIFFVISNSIVGDLKLGDLFITYIENEYESKSFSDVFHSYKNSFYKLFEYLSSKESEYLLEKPNSDFFIEEITYDGKSMNKDGSPLMNKKIVFKISAKRVKELKDKYRFEDGGGVSDRIECHNPKCDWSWSVESGGDDLYVCHKCHTDNKKFYKKGGSLENDFEIEENEDGDRITISLKGIGEVILVQTSPQYEFIEDIDEDTLEELNVSEDDMIGKIEHLEVNDKFKGKGYAKSLMNKAIEIAEEYGWMPLYLNASPMGSKRYGLGIEDLTGFYESFGFKVFLNQGGNNLMLLDKNDIRFADGGDISFKGTLSTDALPYLLKDIRNKYEFTIQDNWLNGTYVSGSLQTLKYIKNFLQEKYNIKSELSTDGFPMLKIINDIIDFADGGDTQPRDLSKINNFEKIYKGAEYYSFSDNVEKQQKSDRWYELFLKNQKEKQLNKNEFIEFMDLSNELYFEDLEDSEDFENGGKIQLNSNKGKVNLKLSSYEDVTELVPVSELLKFREFNRFERPKYSLEDSKDNISKLEKALLENGVEEPLIIEYSLEDNSVLLIEGNHRLNVAENLGFDYLPARVVLRRREFAPLQKTKALKVKGFTPDRYGYVPSDLKPSQVGIGGTTKAFEEGGVVEGQLHSECNEETGCGEKYDVGGVGHIIEVERDEAVIVSKAFEDNNQYEIKGTPSEIASALNVLGDGKNFDSGAEIKSEDGKKVEVSEIKKEAKNTDVETIDPNSIIINRRSMYDEKEYVAKGTPKQIASQINNLNDNGVKIVDGGSIKKA